SGKVLAQRDKVEKKAPVMILLMGGGYSRAFYAANLHKEGKVGKILFAETEQGETQKLGLSLPSGVMADRLLGHFNVPDKDRLFLSETRNTSTFEEAKVLLKEVAKRYPKVKEVLLVTSWYHSSRAKWIFEKMNTYGLDIKSSPTPMPKKWWKNEASFLSVYNEYLKWVYYLVHY
ncbi:MAG: YdcF family protein, partial [Bdellovibrionota bacterium]|nr:YdcF family protein [Bdellovibrionota bacterium]